MKMRLTFLFISAAMLMGCNPAAENAVDEAGANESDSAAFSETNGVAELSAAPPPTVPNVATNGCEPMVGEWEGSRRGAVLMVSIRKVDDVYIVRSDDDDAVSHDANEVAGTCQGATIVKSGMLGNVSYVESEDSIYFAGMQLQRRSGDAGGRTSPAN